MPDATRVQSAATSDAATGAGTTRTVTLRTGDTVSLTAGADGTNAVDIRRGKGREAATFLSSEVKGEISVIPADAVPLLQAGRLDPALFNITQLMKQGYADATTGATPLIATYSRGSTAPDAEVVTKDVTYTNTTDTAVKLKVASSFAAAVPGDGTVTVPAKGTATVPVGVDPAKEAQGRYTGHVTATADGIRGSTAGGFEKAPKTYDLKVSLVGRDGKPSRAASLYTFQELNGVRPDEYGFLGTGRTWPPSGTGCSDRAPEPPTARPAIALTDHPPHGRGPHPRPRECGPRLPYRTAYLRWSGCYLRIRLRSTYCRMPPLR